MQKPKLSISFRSQKIRDAIMNGNKTIETRVLNPEEPERYFGNVKEGECIKFVNKSQKTPTPNKNSEPFGKEFFDKKDFDIDSCPVFDFEDTKKNKPDLHKDIVLAVVKNPETSQFLILDWKYDNATTFVGGGIDDGEYEITAAKREVLEETGYKNLKFITKLPVCKSIYRHGTKDANYYTNQYPLYFELENEEQSEVDPKEFEKHTYTWIDQKDLLEYLNCKDMKFVAKNVLEYINNSELLLEKNIKITKVHRRNNFGEMRKEDKDLLKKIWSKKEDFDKIKTLEEFRSHRNFTPGYVQKAEKNGIVGWEFEVLN